jgi:hypothetical protein
MATVSVSFTAKGAGTALQQKAGESFDYALSGTFVATLVLERSLTGGQSWDEPILSTAEAASGTILVDRDAWYRWRCTAFTSGTADTTLAESSTDVVPGTADLGAFARATETSFQIDTIDCNGGAIDGTPIGTSSRSTVKATSLDASTLFSTTGIETTLTAHAGGTQAAALALSATKAIHHVTVCATAADSVKLPVLAVGERHTVINSGAAALQVFGAGTSTINDIATATGISILPGNAMEFEAIATGKWYATSATVGTMAAQAASAVAITGGTISGTTLTSPTIGGTPVGMLAYDPGNIAINNLRVASDVVSAETVTIGSDIFEVEIVNTDSTDVTAGGTFNNTTNPITIVAATYPNVPTAVGRLIRVEDEIMRVTATGASLTLARGESGTTTAAHADASAIYIGDGIVAGIAVGLVTTLTPTAFTAALVDDINTRGTQSITAVLISANEILLKASAVGAVTTACTETLGGANNAFRASAMSGGRAQGLRKINIQQRVPTAVEIALDHMHFQFDFTPTLIQVFVVVTATPGLAVAWDGAYSISSGLVTVTNAGSTDWDATHTVTIIAQG